MMKRLTARLLLPVFLLTLTGCSGFPAAAGTGSSEDGSKSVELFAMDTVMDLTAYGDGAQAALDASQKEIDSLEELLSRTREDSEVSKINDAGAAGVSVSPSVEQLLSAALDYSNATSGAFDITIAPVVSAWGFTTDSYQVPSQSELDTLLGLVDYRKVNVENRADGSGYQVALGEGQSIDLGGIAKGYASDCVADIFAENGIESGKVSLGGNVYVCGTKDDGSAWRVGVQDPSSSESYVGILSLSDAFAVTSGGYQRYFEQDGKRYHHIIDPATGFPAENGLVSVTVIAPAQLSDTNPYAPGSGTMCDAFSTALFVMGTDKALDFWRTSGFHFDLVLVTDDNRVLVTSGISDQFEKAEGSDYTYEVVS